MVAKFPHPNDIAWDKIDKIKVAHDNAKDIFSFEFELHGRKQKMTISIGKDFTSYTLSSQNGAPLLHGIQKGKEFKLIDFTMPLGRSKKK
ncbi:MAG: hypothetical protein N3G80_03985 [Candidatus Micrarchaeota archaeon]|nr:hypothetical protein [Candidatus Micrarchaeota archaeon]